MESALENILISGYKDDMISFLKNSPNYYDEAIQLALSDNQPFAWRSAWLLFSCMENNDQRLTKYLQNFLDVIELKKDGHQRELLKILMNMKMKSKHEGIIFNICMNIWEQLGKSPSVRITALKCIIQIVEKHDELAEEITFLTQDHYLETLSPGVKRSVKQMIAKFEG
ncbi:MAG: hypothetical protein KDC88_11685 [Ignavibacteriae bacterium]|nr:hypothetical protein [Ignavibacteriota bacterium]